MVPLGALALDGVTEIEVNAEGVTVNVVEALTTPDAAVILVAPGLTVVAKPLEPLVFDIVALVESEDDHTTSFVTSWLVPSEKTPTAVNCCLSH